MSITITTRLLRAAFAVAALSFGAVAQAQLIASEPVQLRRSFAGNLQFVSTTGTLRTADNEDITGVPDSACQVNQGGNDTRIITGIPANPGTQITGAFLYYAGSHDQVDVGQVAPDWDITFEGQNFTIPVADRWITQLAAFGETFDWFGASIDVTSIVQARANPNGAYTFGGLTVEAGAPQCDVEGVLANWALVIVYSDPAEPTRVVNFFEGLRAYRNDSLQLISDNFRTPANPDGRLGVLTWEGDVGNSAGTADGFAFNEDFQFDGTSLINANNPANNQFNSTMSGPGTATPGGSKVFGSDLDVYDVSALLDPAGGEASVVQDYSSGGDLVILTLQVNAIENVAVTDLAITKADNQALLEIGETMDYTLSVTNNGPDDVVDTITVTDTVPNGLQINSATGTGWTCNVAGQDVTCTSAPQPAPNVGVAYPDITINVTMIANPDGGATQFSNTATVALPANAATFDNVAANDSDTEATPVATADVAIVKRASADPVGTNSNFSFSLEVTNNGPDPATNVVVTDPLPAGATFVSVTSTAGACSEAGGTVTCNLGTLPDGETETITIVVTSPGTNQTLVNTATVTTDAQDPDNTNDSDTESVEVNGAPGQQCYLASDGNDSLSRVDVGNTDPASNETTIGAFGGGINDIETIALNPITGRYYAFDFDQFGEIDIGTGAFTPIGAPLGAVDGAAGTLQLDDIDGLAFDSTTNTLFATNLEGGGTPADILVQLDPATGQVITGAFGGDDYVQITGTNVGPRVDDIAIDQATGTLYAQNTTAQAAVARLAVINKATGVGTDVGPILLGGYQYVQVQGLDTDAAGNLIAVTGAAQDSGDGLNLARVITINPANAQVITDTPVDNLGNYEGIACIQTQPGLNADLAVTKVVDDLTPNEGDTVTFTLTLTNNGPGGANAVQVTDQLPAGLDFAAATPSQGTYDDGTGIWSVGFLPNGGTQTLEIEAVVSPDTAGDTITNTATITSSSQDDPVPGNDTDDAEVTVEDPEMTVIKNSAVFSDPVNGTTNPKRIPGAFIDYTIGVTNTGTADADDDTLTVTDPPAGSTGLLNDVSIFVGDLDGTGAPIEFLDGQPSGTVSGTTFNYGGLADATDDLEFSNDGGTTFTYVPTPDAQGFDAAVTNIRVNPKGGFAADVATDPSFAFRYRVRID